MEKLNKFTKFFRKIYYQIFVESFKQKLTYNFPQNRLTDHRINLTIYKLDRIIEGDLNEILNALYEFDLEQKLLEQMNI